MVKQDKHRMIGEMIDSVEATGKGGYNCYVCSSDVISLNSLKTYSVHITQPSHMKNMFSWLLSPAASGIQEYQLVIDKVKTSGYTAGLFCEVCKKASFKPNDMAALKDHLASQKHKEMFEGLVARAEEYRKIHRQAQQKKEFLELKQAKNASNITKTEPSGVSTKQETATNNKTMTTTKSTDQKTTVTTVTTTSSANNNVQIVSTRRSYKAGIPKSFLSASAATSYTNSVTQMSMSTPAQLPYQLLAAYGGVSIQQPQPPPQIQQQAWINQLHVSQAPVYNNHYMPAMSYTATMTHQSYPVPLTQHMQQHMPSYPSNPVITKPELKEMSFSPIRRCYSRSRSRSLSPINRRRSWSRSLSPRRSRSNSSSWSPRRRQSRSPYSRSRSPRNTGPHPSYSKEDSRSKSHHSRSDSEKKHYKSKHSRSSSSNRISKSHKSRHSNRKYRQSRSRSSSKQRSDSPHRSKRRRKSASRRSRRSRSLSVVSHSSAASSYRKNRRRSRSCSSDTEFLNDLEKRNSQLSSSSVIDDFIEDTLNKERPLLPNDLRLRPLSPWRAATLTFCLEKKLNAFCEKYYSGSNRDLSECLERQRDYLIACNDLFVNEPGFEYKYTKLVDPDTLVKIISDSLEKIPDVNTHNTSNDGKDTEPGEILDDDERDKKRSIKPRYQRDDSTSQVDARTLIPFQSLKAMIRDKLQIPVSSREDGNHVTSSTVDTREMLPVVEVPVTHSSCHTETQEFGDPFLGFVHNVLTGILTIADLQEEVNEDMNNMSALESEQLQMHGYMITPDGHLLIRIARSYLTKPQQTPTLYPSISSDVWSVLANLDQDVLQLIANTPFQ